MKKLTLILASVAIGLLSSCGNSTNIDDDIINPVIKDKKYPAAYPHGKNLVISPYKPYNLINTKGIKPGHLARDMSTAKKDSKGKPITSTAKIFRIPSPKKTAVKAVN